MYTVSNVHSALIYFFRNFVPSGVEVLDGAKFGITLDDPRGKNPSVSISIDEYRNYDLELGGVATTYLCIAITRTKSSNQNEALGQLIYQNVSIMEIPIHTDYDVNDNPTPDSTVCAFGQVNSIYVKSMPNFSTDREKFFWSSVISFNLDIDRI